MNYGLNNNLGSANNTNRTVFSAKVNNFLDKTGKATGKGLQGLNALSEFKNAQTGFGRIQAIAKGIMDMMSGSAGK